MEISEMKLKITELADDLQTYYTDHLRRGLTGPEITKQLLEENPELPADHPSEFWLALADTQRKLNILEGTVKTNALHALKTAPETGTLQALQQCLQSP